MRKKNLDYIKKLITEAENNLDQAKMLFEKIAGSGETNYQKETKKLNPEASGKQILGIFAGENMIDGNGKKYSVPANYASKSKLVSGDKLKLMILEDGTFIYKQIEPVKRKKIIGILKIDKNRFVVESGESSYQVLPASITYFKAQAGDQLTILIPVKKKSKWAAVENLLPKN